MAVGQISVKINGDSSGLKKSMSGVSRIMKTALTSAAAVALTALTKKSSETALQVESNMSRVSEIFGSSATAIEQFATKNASALGMSESSAYQYAATYGNLFSTITSSSEESSRVTQAMLQTSAVVASKTGRTMEDTMERIRSGLLGNTEAIEDLGIYVNVAQIEITSAFQKIANGRSWEQLNYQEQQQIRTLAILEQAHTKFGDTVSQTGSFSMSVFSGAIKDLISTFGQFLNMAIVPAIKWVTAFIQVINQGLKSLFGFKSGISSINSATQGIADQTAAQNQLTNAVKKTNKARKSGGSIGIDELNTITNETETESGDSSNTPSSSIATGVFDDIAAPAAQSVTNSLADQIKSAFAKLDFSNLIESWNNLKAAFTPFSENIGAGLLWVWDNVLIPLSKWTINSLLPSFLNILAGAFRVLNSVIEALKPFAIWMWDSFLEPIARWTGGIIISVLGGIANGLNAVADWINNNQKAVEVIAIVIGSFAAAWVLVNAALTIWKVLGVVATAVTTGFGAAVNFLASPITIVILAIGALIAIVVLLVRNWDTVKEAAGKCWDWIKDKWNSVANWFNNAVVQPIARFFGGLWNGIKNGASTLADFIKRYVIQPIVDAFKWLYNGVVGIIEGVINAFIGIINGFISGINWVIETINKIPGIKLSTIQTMNQVHIPRMAAGGVAYGPRVAEIGEYIGARNNPEVVAPLDRLRSIIGDTRTDEKIVMLLESIYGRLDKLELTVINRIGDDLIGAAAERYRANQGVRMINR